MPPNIQKQEKWSLILDAAARVFAKRGYNRTLVTDIAAQAGIGKGTIYTGNGILVGFSVVKDARSV